MTAGALQASPGSCSWTPSRPRSSTIRKGKRQLLIAWVPGNVLSATSVLIPFDLTWDGANGLGEKVATGVYLLVVRAHVEDALTRVVRKIAVFH